MSQIAPPPEVLVRCVSKSTIKPHIILEESQQPNSHYLTPWDLAMLSAHYIQWGLLFSNSQVPQDHHQHQNQKKSMSTIIDELKDSLSITLTHFYPLVGRLVTKTQKDYETQHYYHVFLECNSTQGAEFIHAVADVRISDLITPDVPPILNSFFPLVEPVVNHDGHDIPLLIVQITELVDGVFIGCSFNHVVGDGTSYWNFFNTWSEISRSRSVSDYTSTAMTTISRPPPINNRLSMIKSYIKDHSMMNINLPFTHPGEFIERYIPPAPLREKMFHFSSKSVATLKAKANADCNNNNKEIVSISSFQALSALVWRAMTRARRVPLDKKTTCRLSINNRPRMLPPWPENYFGNCVQSVPTAVMAAELLESSLGWAARMLNKTVVGHTDEKVREWLEGLMKKPMVYQLSHLFCDGPTVIMGSSPRFDMYGNDFGYWGKPVAARSGYGSKCDGKVSWYPGREGGGSVDLEVCLFYHYMSAFESDEELVMYIC